MIAPPASGVLSVLGAGWVTALGRDPQAVWNRILAGDRPAAGRFGENDAPVYQVPLPDDAASGFARLRRSGAISHFASAAAADAMKDAAIQPSGRTALIVASSNGGVNYTRRFYADVIERGSGSPILFPETVYNAAASHVAARFGIDGTALTFVGDATAGADALGAAAELIGAGAADNCLVVAAEEADWLVWEASRCWGLAGATGDPVLSEGAVALVVGPPGGRGLPQIEAVHGGLSCSRAHPLRTGLRRVLQDLKAGGPADLVMLSASGSPADREESIAVDAVLPGVPRLAPKMFLGEAFSASTLAQVLCAVLAIRNRTAARVIVPVVGWSGQIGGLVVGGGDQNS